MALRTSGSVTRLFLMYRSLTYAPCRPLTTSLPLALSRSVSRNSSGGRSARVVTEEAPSPRPARISWLVLSAFLPKVNSKRSAYWCRMESVSGFQCGLRSGVRRWFCLCSTIRYGPVASGLTSYPVPVSLSSRTGDDEDWAAM